MLAFLRKCDYSLAMSARMQDHKLFLLPAPLRCLGVIAKPHDFVRIPDVHIIFVENDAEGFLLSIHKHFTFLRPSGVLQVAHHDDFPSPGIREKNVPVRGDRQPAWIFEICGEYIYAKSLRYRG